MLTETPPGSGVFELEALLDPAEERHRIVKQEDIVVHPDYDEMTGENDIAIIKVAPFPCVQGGEIYPVCLPEDDLKDTANWMNTFVSGWGFEDLLTFTVPSVLRWGKMDIVSNSDCQSDINAVITGTDPNAPTVNIPDSMVCAKGSTGGQGGDPCLGELGTSLVAQKSGDEGFSLVGVATPLSLCGDLPLGGGATLSLPSVFTEVTDFIEDFIKPEALRLVDMDM